MRGLGDGAGSSGSQIKWVSHNASTGLSGAPAKSAGLGELEPNGVSSTNGFASPPSVGRVGRGAFQVVAVERSANRLDPYPMDPIACSEGRRERVQRPVQRRAGSH
jgi:hypothetical protein